MNGISILKEVWEHGPLYAALIVFVFDFGIMSLLMWWDWKEFPFNGKHRFYLSFIINDTVVFPLYMAIAACILDSLPGQDEWRIQPLYHWLDLSCGIFFSLAIVWWEVSQRIHSTRRHKKIWKMYHTVIFPVMFYWLTISIVPVSLAASSVERIMLAVLAMAFLANTVLDAKLPGLWRFARYRDSIELMIFGKNRH